MSSRAPVSVLDAKGPSTVFAAQLDAGFVKQLPYHFARAKGVIAARRVGDAVELWVRPGVTASALSEARRVLGLPVRTLMLAPELFETSLAPFEDAREVAGRLRAPSFVTNLAQ